EPIHVSKVLPGIAHDKVDGMIAKMFVPGQVVFEQRGSIGIGSPRSLAILTEDLLGMAAETGVGVIVHIIEVIGEITVKELPLISDITLVREIGIIGDRKGKFYLCGEDAHEVAVLRIEIAVVGHGNGVVIARVIEVLEVDPGRAVYRRYGQVEGALEEGDGAIGDILAVAVRVGDVESQLELVLESVLIDSQAGDNALEVAFEQDAVLVSVVETGNIIAMLRPAAEGDVMVLGDGIVFFDGFLPIGIGALVIIRREGFVVLSQEGAELRGCHDLEITGYLFVAYITVIGDLGLTGLSLAGGDHDDAIRGAVTIDGGRAG